uniref:Uncharacterized protein n=1 Tax=Setaria italica TaxID=4555 RepID=K4A465_SETIT
MSFGRFIFFFKTTAIVGRVFYVLSLLGRPDVNPVSRCGSDQSIH